MSKQVALSAVYARYYRPRVLRKRHLQRIPIQAAQYNPFTCVYQWGPHTYERQEFARARSR